MRTKRIFFMLALAAVGAIAQASEKLNSGAVDRPLLEALMDVRARTGAEFHLAPELARAIVSDEAMKLASSGDVESLLVGYNYELVHGRDGRVRHIHVSGLSGDGRAAALKGNEVGTAGFDLLTIDPVPVSLPAKYLRLNEGSVAAVRLDPDRLASMRRGETVTLSLSTGNYTIVHDNQFRHENGDVTWVGYVDGVGRGYRVVLTTGREGSLGQIVTPDGSYSLDLEEGRNWLVDISGSGLQSGTLEGDDMDGSHLNDEHAALAESDAKSSESAHYLKGKKAKKAKVKKAKPGNQKADSAASAPGAQATVDVLIVYTRGMNPKKVQTRLNFLVATANQAYLDSEIPLQLRLVAAIASDYPDDNANNIALADLTNGNGALSGLADLRRQYGADLVTLVRPFHYESQKNCGSGWVNGARGTELYATLGYSVVSDGSDPSGWYCSDYTFAHELGHNMGSVHDMANSSFEGKFPFSYGFGTEGKFGTIMSYINPVVGVFSSPRLSCKGMSCGDVESSDNSRSLSLVASQVASFMSATH